MRTILVLGLCAQLAGCCGSLRTAIRAYGIAAEDQIDATTEWVNRCRGVAPAGPDAAACDQALKRLTSLKSAASELKSVK